MKKNDLKAIIEQIKFDNKLSIRDLAINVGLTKNQLDSFMNDRIKKFDGNFKCLIFEVNGDSMYRTLRHGEKIVTRQMQIIRLIFLDIIILHIFTLSNLTD